MSTPKCPNCKIVADDLNLSINISERDENGEYTGDTETAADGQFPTIGFYCHECGYESVDPAQVLGALQTLNLKVANVDASLLAEQRAWLESQESDEAEGILNMLDYLSGVLS